MPKTNFAGEYKNIAQLLIDNNVDPCNYVRCFGKNFTALHIAIMHEDKEMLKILLSKTISINGKNNNFNKSLKNFKNISQLFIENHDNLDDYKDFNDSDISDNSNDQLNNYTPLQLAVFLMIKKLFNYY